MRQHQDKMIDPLKKEFIRLLTDFGFKRIFSNQQHANLLIRFLNALFEGEMVIKEVEFRDKEILPFHAVVKKIYYDVYCTTDRGDHFILEMQQEESENFASRILFYTSSAIVHQGIKGIEYEIDPVYCVVLTDFNLSGMTKSLKKDIILTDRKTGETYTDRMRLIFLSLREVPEDWEECDSVLLRILYLIKNMEDMTKKSKPYVTGEYSDFFEASSTGMLSNEEAVAYSQSYLKELEHQSAIRFAERRGYEKGWKEGYEEGRRQVIARLEELSPEFNISDDMKKKIIAGLNEDF